MHPRQVRVASVLVSLLIIFEWNSKTMSKLIPGMGVCRIEFENDDKDDFSHNTESDVEIFEVISIDESDGEEVGYDGCEHRRNLKRKKDDEEGSGKPSSAQSGEIVKTSSSLQISTVKRFKSDVEDPAVRTSILQQRDVRKSGVAVTQANNVSESKNSLKNENTIREISEKTGLSQTYLLKTDAVRKLAESYFSIKGISSQQEKIGESYNVGSADTIPKIPITSQTQLEAITLQENEKCGIAEHSHISPQMSNAPKTKNSLRAFRLNKNKDHTTIETTLEQQAVVERQKSEYPLQISKHDTCTTSQEGLIKGFNQNEVHKPSVQQNSLPMPLVEQRRKTVLSRHVSTPTPPDVRNAISQQLEQGRNEFPNTSLERITPNPQEFGQKKEVEHSQTALEISLDAICTKLQQQYGAHGIDELSKTSLQNVWRKFEQQQHGTCAENEVSRESPQETCENGTPKPSQHTSLQTQLDKNCTISQQLEFGGHGTDAVFDKSPQAQPSHLQQLGQIARTEHSHTSLESQYDANCSGSQKLHFAGEISETSPPEIHEAEHFKHSLSLIAQLEPEWHCQNKLSDASMQMAEDAFNVKMAAEALSLLRNNGKSSLRLPEKYIEPQPPVSVIVSNVINRTSLQKFETKKDLGRTVEILSNPPNNPSCTTLQQKQTNNHLLFDSTLEITDARTGAKIPFEALNLHGNENSSNEATDSRDGCGEAGVDKILQLSDSVTCVKVPLQKPGLPRNKETTIKKGEPRHAALPKLEVGEYAEKHVQSDKDMQLSVGDVCVHVPLEAIGSPTYKDISKEKIKSKCLFDDLHEVEVRMTKNCIISDTKQMEFKSTVVRIPLESIYLPKCATSGAKIPQDSPSWPRNKAIGRIEPITKQESVERNCESVGISNKIKNERDREQKIQLENCTNKKASYFSFDKKMENISKIGVWRTKNVKLPLKPRLHSRPMEPTKEQNEMRSCHVPAAKSYATDRYKPILAAPTLLTTEGIKVDGINMQRQQVGDKLRPDISNASREVSSNTNSFILLAIPVTKRCTTTSTNSTNELLGVMKPPLPPLHNVPKSANPQIERAGNVTNNAQQQTDDKFLMSTVLYTYPQPSNITKSLTSDTLSLFKNENEAKSETTTHLKKVTEVGNSGPPMSSCVSVIKRLTSTQLNTSGSVQNEDVEQDKTNSEFFYKNGNSGFPEIFPQISNTLRNVETPLNAFNLLINDDMIRRIMKYTNMRIAKLTHLFMNRRNCFKYPADESELNAFLGLLLISGALKQNQTAITEIWSECFGAGIYRATLHEHRFQILLQCICLSDCASNESRDEFISNWDLWEEYLSNCKKYYTPVLSSTTSEKTDITNNDDTETENDGQIYSTARKTLHMPLRILFTMLDGAGLRGFGIFCRLNPTVKMGQREFLKQVGMSLVSAQLHKRVLRHTLRRKDRELIESILNKKFESEQTDKCPALSTDNCLRKQKRCQLCNWNKDRKTKYQCESCQRAMCGEHRTDMCVECVKELF